MCHWDIRATHSEWQQAAFHLKGMEDEWEAPVWQLPPATASGREEPTETIYQQHMMSLIDEQEIEHAANILNSLLPVAKYTNPAGQHFERLDHLD